MPTLGTGDSRGPIIATPSFAIARSRHQTQESDVKPVCLSSLLVRIRG